MTFDDEEVKEEDREPSAEVTRRLFREWQTARRGATSAEEMTNPVWLWLFRGRVDPYHANERFKSRLGKMLGRIDYPSEPRWAGCRMGRSRTELSDGRVFWIAGEHEDYYDPDFFIYNDVIVEHEGGETQIFGYPDACFRPTDFHSATAIESERKIVLIGSIGYADQRQVGRTQIYVLDTETLAMQEIVSKGVVPGWISKHRAELSDEGTEIVVSGGELMTEDGFLENIDDWSLSLSDFRWTRLTARNWIRFQVFRSDQEGLHLWEYQSRKFALEYPNQRFDQHDDLASAIGAEPNMDAYDSLWKPCVPHSVVANNNDDAWRINQIMVEGVLVRYADDMDHVTATVEGSLSQEIVDAIADDLRSKLSVVENCECHIEWID